MAVRRVGSPVVLLDLHARAGRATSWVTLFSFVLGLCAGLVPGRAEAGELPRVLVLPYASVYDTLPRTTGEKTAELLRAELDNSEMVELVSLPEAAGGAAPAVNPAPKRSPSMLDEARNRVESAEGHLKNLKFKQAADDLERAIELFEQQHPHIDFNDLVDAYLSLAVARIRLNQEDEGEKLLATVVRLEPDRKLDSEKFPPVFIRMHERSAKKVKKAERGSILVEPPTAGAAVFLDGVEVGKAPVHIKDVIKGTHYLKVVPPGGEPWADRVDAESGKSVTVRPQLGGGADGAEAIAAQMARNVIDEGLLARVTELAGKAGADFVVLGGVHREKDKIVANSHLFRVKTSKLCLLQRVVFDEAMRGAGIEIYKVGADVTSKVELFGSPETLPAKVSRDALAPAGYAVAVAEVRQAPTGSESSRGPVGRDTDRVVVRTGDRPVTGDEATAPERKMVVRNIEPLTDDRPLNTGIREITARPAGDGLPGGDVIVPKDERVGESSSSTWIWIAAGAAAVLVGSATGGFFYYRAATQPVTGTATINW